MDVLFIVVEINGVLVIILTTDGSKYLYVVFFLLCDSLASEFYVSTFRNTLSVPSSYTYTVYEDGTDRVFRNVGT
jgi:hypothetical protein